MAMWILEVLDARRGNMFAPPTLSPSSLVVEDDDDIDML
jgi:hypothetical protein